MSQQQYDSNQGTVPPPPGPSGIPMPPPAPSNQQYAAAVPQTGVTFTPMSMQSRRRIKHIAIVVVALVAVAIIGTVALTIEHRNRCPHYRKLDAHAGGAGSSVC